MPMVQAPAAYDDTFAARIPHLLLVAGPSGAGKTTFARHLCAGTLPDELRSRLPAGAGDWDRIEGNRFVKRGTRPRLSGEGDQARRGLIVHYDIVHIHRAGIAEYADDPVFGLIQAADVLSVITLQPSPAQLVAQFAAREQALDQQKGRLRGAWKWLVLHPVRRVSLRLQGRDVPDKHDLYRETGWLERCYAQWDLFVGTLPRGARVVAAEPVAGANGQPSFRLI